MLWDAITPHRGEAFVGRVTEGTEPSDSSFAESLLVARVLEVSDTELRIAFDVGRDHSRTWIVTRSAAGVRLKHEHRHADGSEDSVSRYGGDTAGATDGPVLDFPADAYTAELIPRAATNIWTLAALPGGGFAYALRREATGRRFRVEFEPGRGAPGR